MFPVSYATPHRGIFLTSLTRRTGRAGYLLRYPADLGQPGQGGPGHHLGDVVQRHDEFLDPGVGEAGFGRIVIFGELPGMAELRRTWGRS